MKKIILPLLLSIFLVGCGGEPTFDASNDEAMKASAEKMAKNMSPEEMEKFEKAFLKLSMKSVLVAKDGDDALTLMKEKLNGKTAKQIIEMAEK
ncbi:conserved hypothetical protein [Xenorhabdus bovienii str. oregonense]|uniref:Lipoprotein n=1 Tax=Xenorhabdus bovienii str. oregonense TaxID=1398202 RepID=A0A077NZQ8_XENBV|nr:DUF6694 family lipoprotein [Xenorhabdus bovienii]CDH04270.1 conserved hypothetical protein [Xenorhabdus bovienii str. oregonense]